ncbi:hypothetical protein [Mucilaginibacter agri]|uniref:Uncharacterized protein n=1 Tax=Mucilaginibacter agri TaxID=2695265 RepID=A0A965ZF57_9SPHI|nr:hypothetical protein [Mucilaginibacter agri]NCD68611.1 hypothetical protein [Mucilaginibacter agri]
MKKFRHLFVVGLLLVFVAVAVMCNNKKPGETTTLKNTTVITPVNLPSVVPGFTFPQDSTAIFSWLNTPNTPGVYAHAWGIWAGLTAQSGQVFQGDSILVYQTWQGINELVNLSSSSSTKMLTKENQVKRARTLLSLPDQFARTSLKNKLLQKGLSGKFTTGADDTAAFFVGVSYNPPSAAHVVNNGLLKQSVQNVFLKTGSIGAIPAFPDSAINIKPVYYIGKQSDSLIRIPAWPGEPLIPHTFGSNVWNSYVYADVTNSQPKGKIPKPCRGILPTKAQIDSATCNVSDFINYKIDAATANYINQQQGGTSFAAGDIALLVAMHVTTKEISNWTWQTFYWAPNPADPKLPSNQYAVNARPAQLKGAAAHYALSVAYTEVMPNQPVSGGSAKNATPVIGYNPYLEAGFNPQTFIDYPNAWKPNFKYGIQTNCMSCHALASPQDTVIAQIQGQPTVLDIYATDQYVDMKSNYFKNKVLLDFAWSLRDNVIDDVSSKARSAKKK